MKKQKKSEKRDNIQKRALVYESRIVDEIYITDSTTNVAIEL